MAIDHYENFPVASWLCPARIRPAVAAIYHFARQADDLADEGSLSSGQRLAALAAHRADLQAAFWGKPVSDRSPAVFEPLARAIAQYQLPLAPLSDLISAFEQDVLHTENRQWYADHQALFDYASRSANPIGRLLLHLYGVQGVAAERESDAICTALQLINFWQDLSVDIPRQRYYLPQNLLDKHGLTRLAILKQHDCPETRQLVAECCALARQLLLRAQALPQRIGGRAGWELRLVMAGGLRILDKIAAADYTSLQQRPKLGAWDTPHLLKLALFPPPALLF